MPFEQIPYTNFHGTNQDWMIQQIKQMIADWASYRENLDAAWAAYQENINDWRQALDAAFNELHDYVHDYFDNLDVQEEINNKLDEYLEDGTLNNILLPYFNTYTTQINNTVSTQNNKIATLESQVNNFLENTGTLGTEKDPELIDIRVGENSTTYPSAGDAVRGQVGDLKRSILNNFTLNNSLSIDTTANAPTKAGYVYSFEILFYEGYNYQIDLTGENLNGNNASYLYEKGSNGEITNLVNLGEINQSNLTRSRIYTPDHTFFGGVRFYMYSTTGSIRAEIKLLTQAEKNANEIDIIRNDLKDLYIGAFINGHLVPTGIDDDDFSAFRLSTPEIVALPSGSRRNILVNLSENYAVALRTGERSDNLNHNLYWFKNGDYIEIPDGDNYYAISCAKNPGAPSYLTTEIGADDVALLDLRLLVKNYSSITDQEGEKSANASRLNFYSNSNPNSMKNMAVIAHTSDCHGDYTRVENFIEICNRMNVDVAAITGDMVSYKPYQGLDWLKEILNKSNTLPAVCVGNHDAYDDALNDDGVYDLVFDGIEEKIGNTTGKTWYYKDIQSKYLRIISLNLYQYGGTTRSYTHFTSEQLTWLCNALASTPSGYGVLLLYHSPQVNLAASENYAKFYQNVRKYANTYNAVVGSPINDIIDAFIGRTTITKTYTQTGSPASVNVSGDFTSVDSSVEFIAHLTGHFHQDSVCYVPKTTHKQLMLNVVCTNAIYGGTAYPYLCDLSDLPRNIDDVTQNSFNIYVIDRENGIVKITRIGSNTTYNMNKRDYMEIPYKD